MEDVTLSKKKTKLWPILTIATVVIIAVMILIISLWVSGKNTKEIKQRMKKGNKYLAELNYDKAINMYEGVLEINPEYIDAYMGIASAYTGLGDYDKAIDAYDSILVIDEKYADAYIGKADVYVIEEKYEEVLEVLDAAMDYIDKPKDIKKIEDKKEEIEDIIIEKSHKDVILSEATEEEILNDVTDDNPVEEALGEVYEELPQTDYRGNWKIISSESFNDDGTRGLYTFNSDGNMLTMYHYAADGTMTFGIIHSYSDKRLITEEWIDESGKVSSRSVFFYDSNGNVVKEEEYNSQNNLCSYYLYECDGNGNITAEYQKSDRDVFGETKNYYQYDASGNITLCERYFNTDEPYARTSYEYDENNNCVEEIQFDRDWNVAQRICNYYNEYGDFIRKECYRSSGNIDYIIEAEYDFDIFPEAQTADMIERTISYRRKSSFESAGYIYLTEKVTYIYGE